MASPIRCAKVAQTMTPEEIRQMFNEMGLGTEEERAKYRYAEEPEVQQPESGPREMIFIRTTSDSVANES